MSEFEKRKHRACFTGHRPEKLTMDEVTLYAALNNAIECSIKDGFTTFICGMARGVDIVAAEIILKMKKGNSNLRLICALPHPDYEKRWSKDWQQRYNAILSQADYIKTVCDAFSYGAYQRRNEWMVLCEALHIPFMKSK